MPFALRWDRENEELDLIVKTVMRKPNFKTSNKEFPVESINEDSQIWKWNKEDPNNPEVLIQGYGRLMLNQIEDSVVRKLAELTKMAERGKQLLILKQNYRQLVEEVDQNLVALIENLSWMY
jgi:hypothetical protein